MTDASMTARGRMVDLVERLIDRTRNGNIEWTAADNTERAFAFSGPNSAVTIESRRRDGSDGVNNYELSLYNERGSVVMTLRSTWFRERSLIGLGQGIEVAANWNGMLETLYEEARRVALDVDDVLDDLISSLEDESAD
ncbi:hypothetical protein [Actinomadura rayongensis]|uniref:Uncharacterized protein n=1 Tax=Actinomadura rayongensis TaxID=1429076 RepID=A0A6I4WH27_9ACTN|nr:hypothetical protein [Actinomadura rayongensis]MXQ68213.1 hypothetical protein [Actinomadura rayongensis]